RDTDGHLHLVSASWQVSGDVGTIGAEGLFTATARGHGFVVASYDSFTCDAPIAVVTKVSSTVLEEDATWTPEGSPYVLNSWVVVPKGKTLTLEPGTVVKVGSGGFFIEGTLISQARQGEPPITFTSLKDDSALGDTNVDRISNLPWPGDWSTIYFASGATSTPMEGTKILYAGKSTRESIVGGRYVESYSAVYTRQAQPTFRSCTVAHSAGNGIQAFNSGVTLEDNTLRDIQMSGLQAMSYSNDKAAVLRHNNISDCFYGVFLYRTKGVIAEDNLLSDLQGAIYIVDEYFGIPLGVSIKNNQFRHCAEGLGIFAKSVPGNIEISGNTFSHCRFGEGVVVVDETDATTSIFSNTLTCPDQDGGTAISVSPGTNTTRVYDNTISGYAGGIAAGSYGNATVRDNNIQYAGSESSSVGICLANNPEWGIPIVGENANCTGNTISGYLLGVWIYYDGEHYFTNTNISHNNITGPGPQQNFSVGIGSGLGGGAGGSQEATLHLESNRISGYIVGVLTADFPRVTVIHHTYQITTNPDGFGMGFWFNHAADVPEESLTFTENKVEGPGFSLMSGGYKNVSLMQNIITCSTGEEYGIAAYVSGPSVSGTLGSCRIGGNTVSGKLIGILAQDFASIQVSNNNASEIEMVAFMASGGAIDVFNNRVTSSETAGAIYTAGEKVWVHDNTSIDQVGVGILCSYHESIPNLETTIERNRVTSAFNGISLRKAGLVNITDNLASGTGAENSVGLYLHDFSGNATGNELTGFAYGVKMTNPPMFHPFTNNKMYGNTEYGLYNYGPEPIFCSDNWWGHPSGPKPHGDGDKIGGWYLIKLNWKGRDVWYGRVNGHDPHCPARAEPVNATTGNFYSSHTDLNFEGTGPQISVTRTYNSIDCSTDGPLGYGWSYTYSERITNYPITDPPYSGEDMMLVGTEGNLLRYIHNGDGTYSPEDEDYSKLTHEADGTWTISHKDGNWEKFDASGLIVRIADTNGNVLRVSRDSSGRATSVTDACGQTATFSYNDQGRITKVTDPAGRTISYSYDGNGNLTRVTDLNGGVTRYTYDDGHRITRVADPIGNEFVNNTYDDLDRVVRQVDSRGKEVRFSYDEAEVHRHTFTDALGHATEFQDDVKLYQIGETDPYGESLSITYDSDGNVTSRTDKLGNTTTMTYDEDGNMLSETDDQRQLLLRVSDN
ncbi:MAG: DUF6531 domain-containing protein, partial [Actinomycetia bacterium]|nr:DUF6531 domain-containing protein [Actinomycetes bacterium]